MVVHYPTIVNIASVKKTHSKSSPNVGSSLATLPFPVIVGGADRRALSGLLGSDRRVQP